MNDWNVVDRVRKGSKKVVGGANVVKSEGLPTGGSNMKSEIGKLLAGGPRTAMFLGGLA